MSRPGICTLFLVVVIWTQQTTYAENRPPLSFSRPQRVEIRGYHGDAMEPFISCDGRTLYFNTRNDPPETTDIASAQRLSDGVFQWRGTLAGINAPDVLDGVVSVDEAGHLFFVSTRSYDKSLRTLYVASVRQPGQAPQIVRGTFARDRRGWLTMDAEISRDGRSLYFVDARFSGGALPDETSIGLARRTQEGFNVDAASQALLKVVNGTGMAYAPSISRDERELFYTVLKGLDARIWVARRASTNDAFDSPEQIEQIDGFAEGPSISCDARTLYFHKREGRRYVIYRLDIARE